MSAAAQAPGGPPPGAALAPGGVYTTVSGTTAQFNYDLDAEKEGFLIEATWYTITPPVGSVMLAISP